MLANRWSTRIFGTCTALLMLATSSGCAQLGFSLAESSEPEPACSATESIVNVEQAQLFREAETERATQLIQEISRLQADLRTAESALVEAESGLAGSHTRADAISSLATTRIQVLRAESRAPWRSTEIGEARLKLEEAERQVVEGRFGAALFFVYRARRVAEGILEEAEIISRNGSARLIRGARVNLRAGPSTTETILSVLTQGTPVFPQVNEGQWVLVQVSSGPSGWIHRRLIGGVVPAEIGGPAAPLP